MFDTKILATATRHVFMLRFLGYGFIFAWGHLLWETPILSARSAGELLPYSDASWLVSAIVTPLSLLGFALVGRGRELGGGVGLVFLGAALGAVGTVLMPLWPIVPDPFNLVVLVVSGVCTGAAPAILIVLWGRLFYEFDFESVEIIVPACFLVNMICAVIVPFLAAPAALVATASLPIASGACLVLSRRSLECGFAPLLSRGQAPVRQESDESAKMSKTALRIFAVVFFSYALNVTLVPADPAVYQGFYSIASALGCLCAIGLSIVVIFFSVRIDLVSLYKWITPLLVLSIALSPWRDPSAILLRCFVSTTAVTGLATLLMLAFVRMAQRSSSHGATFFIALGGCASYSGILVNGLLSVACGNAIALEILDPMAASLIAIVALVFSSLFMPESAGLTRHVVIREAELPPSSEHEKANENRMTMELACSEIAQAGGLSAREAEVFSYLAQGRSQPYIQDMLTLSKNTVATHARHIYQKLGVHSKQELIDLVEARMLQGR